jgi:hypothetical protein
MANATRVSYASLSPWAEVDNIPPRGLKPRLADLKGKTIGLFIDSKRAAKPMLNLVEKKLKERYPVSEFSYFYSIVINEPAYETDKKGQFEDWLRGVDAVVAAVGD